MPRRLYSFAIDQELAEALKRLKARDGAPESESIRRALAMYLTKKGVLKPKPKDQR
jgi:Ribbon-helix-helix protein, copG family